jgi:hypothetical protein
VTPTVTATVRWDGGARELPRGEVVAPGECPAGQAADVDDPPELDEPPELDDDAEVEAPAAAGAGDVLEESPLPLAVLDPSDAGFEVPLPDPLPEDEPRLSVL